MRIRIILIMMLLIGVSDANAGRFGGGKSYGISRSYSPKPSYKSNSYKNTNRATSNYAPANKPKPEVNYFSNKYTRTNTVSANNSSQQLVNNSGRSSFFTGMFAYWLIFGNTKPSNASNISEQNQNLTNSTASENDTIINNNSAPNPDFSLSNDFNLYSFNIESFSNFSKYASKNIYGITSNGVDLAYSSDDGIEFISGKCTLSKIRLHLNIDDKIQRIAFDSKNSIIGVLNNSRIIKITNICNNKNESSNIEILSEDDYAGLQSIVSQLNNRLYYKNQAIFTDGSNMIYYRDKNNKSLTYNFPVIKNNCMVLSTDINNSQLDKLDINCAADYSIQAIANYKNNIYTLTPQGLYYFNLLNKTESFENYLLKYGEVYPDKYRSYQLTLSEQKAQANYSEQHKFDFIKSIFKIVMYFIGVSILIYFIKILLRIKK